MACANIAMGTQFCKGMVDRLQKRAKSRQRKALLKQQMKEVTAMSEYQLRDLGYSRDELLRSVREHFSEA